MRKLFTLLLIFFVSVGFSQTVHWYLKTTGSNVTSPSNWTDASNGVGGTSPAASEFSQANRVWHIRNRTSTSAFFPWNLNAASTVSIDGNVSGSTPGNINFNCILTASVSCPIDIASGNTLTIGNSSAINYSLGNLDANSTVVYNSTFIPVSSVNYGNLIIAASTSLSTSGNPFVFGLLTINSGRTLNLNNNGLYLSGTNGSIAGAGAFIGSNLSWIGFQGGNGGNNGTIRFSPGTDILDYMIIGYNTSSDYFTLGSNLNINVGTLSSFIQITGGVDLNGNTLNIASGADISLPIASTDGFIRGNSSSKVFIDGTVGSFLAPTLYMDATNNTLGVLSLNNATAMDAGNTLNIADSLAIKSGGTFNTNGNVTLTSNATLKGRLADMSNGTINGNLTVQTFNAGSTTDWVVMGVSGISGQTLSNWDGQFPMTCNGCTQPTTAVQPGGFASCVNWNETLASPAAYETMSNTDALTPGKGFWIYLGSGLASTTDLSWTVAGSPVVGNTNIGVTNSGAAAGNGSNLLANPYPSPISWNKFRATNAGLLGTSMYIYSPDHAATTSFNGVTSSHPGGANNVIPMGQGFYVDASGNGNVTFQESHKVDNNTGANPLLKSSSSSAPSIVRLKVKDAVNKPDYCVVSFNDNASTSFDTDHDAHKIYSAMGYVGAPASTIKKTTISTVLDKDYSINTIPYPQAADLVIPVLVKVKTSGQVTISANDIENLPAGACVKLRDNLTNITTDLQSSDYTCNMSSTTNTPRFDLIFCGASVPTSINNQTQDPSSLVFINKDINGVFVSFDYNQPTDATISVYNLMGQKLLDDKKVKTAKSVHYLNLNIEDQLIFVTVTTPDGKTTKKFMYRNN
ncbi:MAG: hypothetical protein AB7O73_06950 [Bacteroidia bacterium]